MPSQSVILFDGICNLCNSAVRFVIKRDQKSVFRFAPLQSAVAHEMLSHRYLSSGTMSSMVLVEKDQIYTESTAVLRICRRLDGLWPILYGAIIIPKFIRDGVYRWVARNRYRWFGNKRTCMIPTPELKSRFLMETNE